MFRTMDARTKDTVIRGYHVYQSIWTPVKGEQLACISEPNNRQDPNAVAVTKEIKSKVQVVGHLPREEAKAYSEFLMEGGVITCEVTGSPRQGHGVEVPCRLKLIGSEQLFEEAMKHGYVNSRDTKILICGAAGSGKTCFRHLLLGDPPPKTRTSTPLAVRPVTVHCFDASSNWKEFSIVERKVNLVMAMKNHLRQDSSSVDGENDYPNLQETLEDTSETSSSENAEKVVDSVTIDEELISLLPRCSSSAPITSFQRFHIIDSGGQPEFYELLPIFMKDLSACVFVVKLSDELSSQPTAVWYRRGQKYPFSYKSDKTHEQLFKLCIRTVHSLKITSKKEVSPKILVLGTHKDEEEKCTETREEKNRKLADALFPLYEDDVISPGVGGEVLFGVDAKTPGPEDQRVATDIRQFIAEIPRTPVKIPHQWYALEIMLKDQADILGRGVLTKECFKVASKKLHFNESSLTAALKHLNGLSLVFYREDILPNVVFVNPQVPLDKVTDLVIVRYNMDSYRYPMCADTRAFFDRALVSIDFLKKFKRHYFPGVFTAANLVELFRKLFVLADYDSTKFFIPALLEMSTPEELDKYRVLCDSPVPPLVVEFSSDTPLLGVFCTLVCFLLSKRKCKSDSQWTLNRERTRTPTCLHRNCIQFNIPRCSHGVVTMIDADRRFEFHIAHGLTNDNFQILCPIIHGAVREGLTSVNEVLSYKTSEPTNAILCPCGNGDLHTATVDITRKEWICGNDSLVHDSLSENQTLWLQQDSAEWSSLEEESGRLETKKGTSDGRSHVQALDECTSAIQELLCTEAVSLECFAAKLIEKDFLDRNGVGSALDRQGSTKMESVRRLMDTVAAQIKLDCEKFKDFLDVLSSFPSLKVLVTKLNKSLESVKRKRSAKQSSERAKRPRMK